MKKACVFILVVLSFFSCKKDDDISYPYSKYEIIYMGTKSGLTSSSSDQAFGNALTEIVQQWVARQPDSSTEFTLDGITYEISNVQNVVGGIPNNLWDIFWESLDEYGYSIGSCWGFIHMQIPSRGASGTAYVIYAIVNDEYNAEVWYMAVKEDVTPVKTRSVSNTQTPLHFIIDKNMTAQQNKRQK